MAKQATNDGGIIIARRTSASSATLSCFSTRQAFRTKLPSRGTMAFRSDEHFVATKTNVYRTMSVRRLPPLDKHNLALLESVESTPWATRGVGEAATDEFVLPLLVPSLSTTTSEDESGPNKQSDTAKTTVGTFQAARAPILSFTGFVISSLTFVFSFSFRVFDLSFSFSFRTTFSVLSFLSTFASFRLSLICPSCSRRLLQKCPWHSDHATTSS